MTMLAPVLDALAADRTLARSEARDTMSQIVDGAVTLEETALFLTALARRAARVPETADELGGCAEVLRERMVRVQAPRAAIDTCGTGGSGRPKLNVGTLAAIVVASLGRPVAKHGNRSSSAIGSSDILERVGLPLTSPGRSEQLLGTHGLAFLHAPLHHPSLARVAPLRRALGFRTIFNLLGPLASPASVSRQLVGTSDPRRALPIASALSTLGTERAIVFGGELDELPIDEPRTAHEVRAGAVHELVLDPGSSGVRPLAGALCHRGGFEGLTDVLEARSEGAVELVAWNAAVALALSEAQGEEPLELANAVTRTRAAIVDGVAARFFEHYLVAARGPAIAASEAA